MLLAVLVVRDNAFHIVVAALAMVLVVRLMVVLSAGDETDAKFAQSQQPAASSSSDLSGGHCSAQSESTSVESQTLMWTSTEVADWLERNRLQRLREW